MARLADLKGQVFGRLTVLGRGPNIGERPGWSCLCDCGNPEPTLVRTDQLKKGIRKDYGCSHNPYTKGIYGPFIDRQTALKQGLTQYFPGTTCPKGHVSPRLTSGGSCIVCHQELMVKKQADGYFREYAAKRRETDLLIR